MDEIDFRRRGERFLQRLSGQLEALSIELPPHWSIDHLCYRTASLKSYETLRETFRRFGDLLIESDVNGRAISTFRLREPFRFLGRTVPLLELPAPKAGKETPEGFEHVEIVCDETWEELERRFPSARFDRGGLEKDFNQELEVELPSAEDGSPAAVKFHHLSLASVIRFESNSCVAAAVAESGLLALLREYRHLIAGTFPLGVETESSDVDILLEARETDRLEELVKGKFPEAQIRRGVHQGQASWIARFHFAGTAFELFAQNRPSVKQQAFRHFQVEERLLELGGESFRKALLRLRLQGLKTEPAFAQVLGLEGDPYEALLRLHGKSEPELRALLERRAPFA